MKTHKKSINNKLQDRPKELSAIVFKTHKNQQIKIDLKNLPMKTHSETMSTDKIDLENLPMKTQKHLPCQQVSFGSLYISGKLPTYPSPNPKLTLTSHLGQTAGLGIGERQVSSFPSFRWYSFPLAGQILKKRGQNAHLPLP